MESERQHSRAESGRRAGGPASERERSARAIYFGRAKLDWSRRGREAHAPPPPPPHRRNRSSLSLEASTVLFHMLCWTKNKDNKILFMKQMGMWYTKEECTGSAALSKLG